MLVAIDIPESKIVTALMSACEQWSGYWAETSDQPWAKCKIACGEEFHLELPITVTDKLDDRGPQRYTLTEQSLKTGLARMATEQPQAFAQLLDIADAPTGDILLQQAILGGVIYG